MSVLILLLLSLLLSLLILLLTLLLLSPLLILFSLLLTLLLLSLFSLLLTQMLLLMLRLRHLVDNHIIEDKHSQMKTITKFHHKYSLVIHLIHLNSVIESLNSIKSTKIHT
jgi:hypothetical protein